MTRARRPWWFIGLGVLAVSLLVALGVWQLQRLQWKTALIERVEAGLIAPPSAAPGPDLWTGVTSDTAEYRRVEVRGQYLSSDDTLVKAVTSRGSGFWVMTPFETDGGWRLFINRGFVPDDWTAPTDRPKPEGEQTVTGLLRLTQPGGAFLRDNDPTGNRWFSRDTVAMAGALGLGQVAPYFIDANASGDGFPIGGFTVVSFPNKHFGYAMTWFGLAAVFAFLLCRATRPDAVER
ncbi:MAG: SURF1 family protein [Rhizobium rhizophilum]|uniref:SURF1 family protein n=1 Tax=Rhizobium rhizophilum TaxID=1850373 RepID=UPI00391A2D91